MRRALLLLFVLNPFVFVVPDDVDPLCSKYRYLIRYSLESQSVEKYHISIKNTDVIMNSNKIYFGDGLYRKFRNGIFVSVACDTDPNDIAIVNSYDFSKFTKIISFLNYNFQRVIIIYNPMESYDNLYYYCVGRKFNEYLSKMNYKVDYVSISDYNSLVDYVNKIRSNRVVHIINNSIDYIPYKGKIINNSSISKFIMDNTDNVILVSFSSYHCKYGIAHICIDSGYDEFKSSLDMVILGKAKRSIIVNDLLSVNSSIFRIIKSPDIDSIIVNIREMY